MNDMLVIIDMVNGFVKEGALSDKKIMRIVDPIVNRIKQAIDRGEKIVAFKDTHRENDVEFEQYPKHCVRGTSECDLIDEIKVFEEHFEIIEKDTTNGFITDKFNKLISSERFDNITVVGCCTDICVASFVSSLMDYLKVCNINTKVKIPHDMVDTFNGVDHNADEVNEKYLKIMNSLGVEII